MTTVLDRATAVARTYDVPDTSDVLAALPDRHGVLSWVRDGEGFAAWGEAFRLEFTGPDRFAQAAAGWRRLADRITAGDPSAVVAFASFGFTGRSVLVVPKVLVGRRNGRSWVTTVGEPRVGLSTPVVAPGPMRWSDGALPVHRWRAAVAEAVRRIRSGQLDKVVLARDLVAEADEPVDPRFVLRKLAARHRKCWTFAVDGLVGATPELLLRRAGDQVSSRVLAGTSWPGADQELMRSESYLDEHRFAVDSLLRTLGPHCTSLRTSGPSVLQLRGISHLSTDVTGTAGGAGLLDLVGAVHPTAAVGGTPGPVAARLIEELESPLDRGRYTGPVGWVDAAGDGELGIALRCAQLSGTRARLFAGAGLVAESDPDVEVRETHAKFAAMREVLGD